MNLDALRDRFGSRLLQIGATAAIVVAFVGLATGTRQTASKRGYEEPARFRAHAEPGNTRNRAAAQRAQPAVSYLEWRDAARGPNADIYADAFEPLERATAPRADAEKTRDVETLRRERRAYEGAPPTIPHSIEAHATSQCIACHKQGVVVFGKTAPIMSHREYPVCTQCHVPEQSEVPAGPPLTENVFDGWPAAKSP